MSGVSVSGNLPAGDGNGLNAIIPDLLEEPGGLHVAVVIINCKKITRDTDTGESIPTVRIRRIEVISEDEDKRVCERLMRRALDTRTGREALPYDLEAEISDVFKDVHPQELNNDSQDDNDE